MSQKELNTLIELMNKFEYEYSDKYEFTDRDIIYWYSFVTLIIYTLDNDLFANPEAAHR